MNSKQRRKQRRDRWSLSVMADEECINNGSWRLGQKVDAVCDDLLNDYATSAGVHAGKVKRDVILKAMGLS